MSQNKIKTIQKIQTKEKSTFALNVAHSWIFFFSVNTILWKCSLCHEINPKGIKQTCFFYSQYRFHQSHQCVQAYSLFFRSHNVIAVTLYLLNGIPINKIFNNLTNQWSYNIHKMKTRKNWDYKYTQLKHQIKTKKAKLKQNQNEDIVNWLLLFQLLQFDVDTKYTDSKLTEKKNFYYRMRNGTI